MGVLGCWFCGAPAHVGAHLRVGLHRDVEESFLGLYREWRAAYVLVPRCRRCQRGHTVERGIGWVLIGSGAITGLLLLAWGASRLSGEAWADEWQLLLPVAWTAGWLALWRAVRQRRIGRGWLGPRSERYGREHPAALQLADEGWDQREGPR